MSSDVVGEPLVKIQVLSARSRCSDVKGEGEGRESKRFSTIYSKLEGDLGVEG